VRPPQGKSRPGAGVIAATPMAMKKSRLDASSPHTGV